MNQHDISDQHLRRQRAADMEEDKMEMGKAREKEALEEKQADKRHEHWQRKKQQEDER